MFNSSEAEVKELILEYTAGGGSDLEEMITWLLIQTSGTALNLVMPYVLLAKINMTKSNADKECRVDVTAAVFTRRN